MTLNDIIRKANEVAMQLSSGDVPLEYQGGLVKEINLVLLTYEDGKPFIDIELF